MVHLYLKKNLFTIHVIVVCVFPVDVVFYWFCDEEDQIFCGG